LVLPGFAPEQLSGDAPFREVGRRHPPMLGKKGWELDLKSNVSQWTLFGGLEVVTHWDYSLATLRPGHHHQKT
jgi:hypothetical protein